MDPIFTALVSLSTGVIGYLLKDNTNLKGNVRVLRGLVFGLSAKILDDDNADDEVKNVARQSVEALSKI